MADVPRLARVSLFPGVGRNALNDDRSARGAGRSNARQQADFNSSKIGVVAAALRQCVRYLRIDNQCETLPGCFQSGVCCVDRGKQLLGQIPLPSSAPADDVSSKAGLRRAASKDLHRLSCKIWNSSSFSAVQGMMQTK